MHDIVSKLELTVPRLLDLILRAWLHNRVHRGLLDQFRCALLPHNAHDDVRRHYRSVGVGLKSLVLHGSCVLVHLRLLLPRRRVGLRLHEEAVIEIGVQGLLDHWLLLFNHFDWLRFRTVLAQIILPFIEAIHALRFFEA